MERASHLSYRDEIIFFVIELLLFNDERVPVIKHTLFYDDQFLSWIGLFFVINSRHLL